MSEAPRFLTRALLMAAAVVVLLTPDLGAQAATQYDALRDYWGARNRVQSAKLNQLRFAADSAITDTTRALRFEVLSSSSDVPIAAELAHVADSLVRTTWMPPLPGVRPRFSVHRPAGDLALDESPLQQPSSVRLVLSVYEPDGGRTELMLLDSRNPAIGAARTAVRRSVIEALVDSLDPAFRAWLADRPVAELPSPGQWRDGWLELATYPSLPARGCLVGEFRACEAALALVSEPNPLKAWYDPALRQVLGARGVQGWRGERLTEPQRLTVEACAGGHDDGACLRFLSDTALGANSVEPGPHALRSLLVRFAFSFPADSAARARAAYAPGLTVQDRLSRASGLPFDELLRRFHQQLSARRPPPSAPSGALLWTSSIWCLAFGALSLRSTRWRG